MSYSRDYNEGFQDGFYAGSRASRPARRDPPPIYARGAWPGDHVEDAADEVAFDFALRETRRQGEGTPEPHYYLIFNDRAIRWRPGDTSDDLIRRYDRLTGGGR